VLLDAATNPKKTGPWGIDRWTPGEAATGLPENGKPGALARFAASGGEMNVKLLTGRDELICSKPIFERGLVLWIMLVLALSLIFLAGCKPAATAAAPSSAGTSAPSTQVGGTADTFQTLIPAAQAFVDQMNQGDFTAAVKPFDATMIQAMPESKLKDTWLKLLDQVGPFKSQLGTRTESAQGYRIVYVTCEFTNAVIDIQVVFNNQDQVSGLFFKPGQRPAGTSEIKISPSLLTLMAENLVDQLVQGNYAAAASDFNPDMQAAAPEATLKNIWDQLLVQRGAFLQRIESSNAVVQGYQTVFVTCQFEKGALDAQVTFDNQGKIAGLHFAAHQAAGATAVPYSPPAYVKSDSFQETNVTVGSGKWALPGTLTVPKGQGPFPAVVLVHGSGPNDRDETIGPNKPFRDLAWGLASQGIAVLRYDKRTKAHADLYTRDILMNLTLQEETIDDALLAVQLLRSTPEIDPQRIFVLGHSLGAMAAPRIGQQDPDLAGLILLAGPTIPLEDEILDQFTYLFNLDGTLTAPEKAYLDKIQAEVARVKDPNLSNQVPAYDLPLSMYPAYWLYLRDYHPAEVAKTLAMPMLVLQGGRDYQVSPTKDFEGWKTALADKANAVLKLYPDLNHLMIAGQGPSTPTEYEIAGHVSEEVVKDIADWIKTP
jgi:dienelactone hydrolase